jgi:microcystin-dependent protein
MTDQFVGEIRMVPYNFAPVGWAFCSGQILAISQNTALFALLGTFYGGNGTSNFALPNLQGCAPVSMGQGVGLSEYEIGETGGTANVTLTLDQIPAHNHPLNGSGAAATTNSPAGNVPAVAKGSGRGGASFAIEMYAPGTAGPSTALSASQLTSAGGGQSHNNLQPFLTMNYIIALSGIFPARS